MPIGQKLYYSVGHDMEMRARGQLIRYQVIKLHSV